MQGKELQVLQFVGSFLLGAVKPVISVTTVPAIAVTISVERAAMDHLR
jgi:hypothetical protein